MACLRSLRPVVLRVSLLYSSRPILSVLIHTTNARLVGSLGTEWVSSHVSISMLIIDVLGDVLGEIMIFGRV